MKSIKLFFVSISIMALLSVSAFAHHADQGEAKPESEEKELAK